MDLQLNTHSAGLLAVAQATAPRSKGARQIGGLSVLPGNRGYKQSEVLFAQPKHHPPLSFDRGPKRIVLGHKLG